MSDYRDLELNVQAKTLEETRDGRDLSLSVIKAARILRAFDDEHPLLSLPEVVARTGLPRTVCHRLLATLEDEGFVTRNPATSLFELGLGLFALAGAAVARTGLSAAALPAMRSLSQVTSDTVLLVVEHELRALCIDRVEGSFPIQQSAMTTGRSLPLHCGGAPFCLLSHMPPERSDLVLAGPLQSLTSHTVTDPAQIATRMERVRDAGYAVGNEDVIDYLVAIGVPLYGNQGQLVGALSVGGLTQRYPPERVAEVAALALDTAAEISSTLGLGPPSRPQPGSRGGRRAK